MRLEILEHRNRLFIDGSTWNELAAGILAVGEEKVLMISGHRKEAVGWYAILENDGGLLLRLIDRIRVIRSGRGVTDFSPKAEDVYERLLPR